MRSVKYTLALASIGALLAFASCTLITDVDRSKIPSADASTGEGGGGNSAGKGGGAGQADVTGDAGNAGSTG